MKQAEEKLAKQTKAALKILAPSDRLLKGAQENIELAIAEIAFVHGQLGGERSGKEVRLKTTALRKALARARSAARTLARLEYGWTFLAQDLRRRIEECDEALANKTPRNRTYRQKRAVGAAYHLVERYGDKKHLRATRGNSWHRLAAVLYGDPKIDLFNHMRAHSRPSAGIK